MRVAEELYAYQKMLNDKIPDDDILNFVLPVREETRIECINPKLVSEENYTVALEKLEKAKNWLEDFLKEKPDESRTN